jgi:hypothetical protein
MKLLIFNGSQLLIVQNCPQEETRSGQAQKLMSRQTRKSNLTRQKTNLPPTTRFEAQSYVKESLRLAEKTTVERKVYYGRSI